jgi:type II secretory pathway component PulC
MLLLSALLFVGAVGGSDVAVVGIVMGPGPAASSAILHCEGRTRIVSAGDAACGGRVATIAPGRVSLDLPTGRLEARLTAGAAVLTPPPAVLKRDAAYAPEDPETPARSMERREVERRIGDELQRILAETALTPVIEDGKVTGVALSRMPPGTVLSDAGLRVGDVLTRINDTQIDGLASLMGLWPRLQNERELRAVVLRQGRPVSLVVTLR